MTRVRISDPALPPALHGWTLIDSFGFPRYWPTVWQVLRGGKLAYTTQAQAMSAIERLYVHAEYVLGSDRLDEVLATRDLDALETVLQGFFVSLRNVGARTDMSQAATWQFAVGFAKDIAQDLAYANGVKPLAKIEARIKGLDRLYRSLRPADSNKRRERVRALPAMVIEDLYEVMDPTSRRNPFKNEANRWRNYALFLLLLHQGLRRSEPLLLSCRAIHDQVDPETGEIVRWMNVRGPDGEEDPRTDQPALKTILSERQIPISPDIAGVVDHYVDNFRRNRQDHVFLFDSTHRLPLAKKSVNDIFDVVSGALSEGALADLLARNGTKKITPHDFRHTCAVARLSELVADGMEMKLALESMRPFFGWTRTSDMPLHYAHAYFQDRLKTVWRGKFDDRVSFLRQLRAIERNADLIPEGDFK